MGCCAEAEAKMTKTQIARMKAASALVCSGLAAESQVGGRLFRDALLQKYNFQATAPMI